jgi:hypothetical protein
MMLDLSCSTLAKRQHQFCNLSWAQLLQGGRDFIWFWGLSTWGYVPGIPRLIRVAMAVLPLSAVVHGNSPLTVLVSPLPRRQRWCRLCWYLFFVCSIPVACLVSSYWSAIAKWLATCCMRMTQHNTCWVTGFVEIVWPHSPKFVKSELAPAKICQSVPSIPNPESPSSGKCMR